MGNEGVRGALVVAIFEGGYGLLNPQVWWVSRCSVVLVCVFSLVTPKMVNDVAFG